MSEPDLYTIRMNQVGELSEIITGVSEVFEGRDLDVVMVAMNTILVSTIMTHVPEAYQKHASETFMNTFMITMGQAGINLYPSKEEIN